MKWEEWLSEESEQEKRQRLKDSHETFVENLTRSGE